VRNGLTNLCVGKQFGVHERVRNRGVIHSLSSLQGLRLGILFASDSHETYDFIEVFTGVEMNIISLLFFITAILLAGCSRDRDARQATNTPTVAPDNTGRNVRDRDGETKTPGDQAESDADRTITQNVRKALTADDSLSTNAKNVKIITNDGTVTLRGPVQSGKEKADIEAKAKQVAGVKQVDNQ
jgi:hyperosmotically inducible periplasmic protein